MIYVYIMAKLTQLISEWKIPTFVFALCLKYRSPWALRDLGVRVPAGPTCPWTLDSVVPQPHAGTPARRTGIDPLAGQLPAVRWGGYTVARKTAMSVAQENWEDRETEKWGLGAGRKKELRNKNETKGRNNEGDEERKDYKNWQQMTMNTLRLFLNIGIF